MNSSDDFIMLERQLRQHRFSPPDLGLRERVISRALAESAPPRRPWFRVWQMCLQPYPLATAIAALWIVALLLHLSSPRRTDLELARIPFYSLPSASELLTMRTGTNSTAAHKL